MVKKVVLALVLIVVVVMGYVGYLFREQYAAAKSVRLVTEGIYTLTYEGDYGFDDFLAQGGASSTAEMADYITSFLTHGLVKARMTPQSYGCSSITATDSTGTVCTGRNFDWPEKMSDIVVVHARPTNGYASVSTCAIQFLGFGEGWKPEGIQNQMSLLASVYAPLDGMNEKGLYVASLVAGDTLMIDQRSDRPDLTTAAATRLMLDKAATTDEAISLLSQYDIHSDIHYALHLAISDATGKSVVVEWVDNEMLVADTPLCTNHYLAESNRKGQSMFLEDSSRRYQLMEQQLQQHSTLSEADVTASICQVAGADVTRWTVVFNHRALTATYYQWADFSQPYKTGI